ncbi:MAG: hypothetical protein Q7U76_12840 [Nitrospirota bacterium]|nr:hypothetical protein [Nitrospirota bacterium]
MMCPKCQSANLMDATAELDETFNDGQLAWLKCLCGWRGKLDAPVKQEEQTMGKWSEEARLAFHARKAAAKHEEDSTRSVVPVTCQSIPSRSSSSVTVDGSALTILDATLEKLSEDVTTLIRAKEIVERYQA